MRVNYEPTPWREMKPSDRMALIGKVERAAKMAHTYARKASHLLHLGIGMPLTPLYWDLLDQCIETATEIVGALPDSFFQTEATGDYFGLASAFGLDPQSKYNSSDGPFEAAQGLLAAIEKRREREKLMRRIMALENTTGRTPEEAEGYEAKAAELREQLEAAK